MSYLSELDARRGLKPQLVVPGKSANYFSKNPEAAQRYAAAALSFREFLNHWKFIDQDTGDVRVLGEILWPAQERFVEATRTHDWIFFLKARKLGESTIECAYDAWVLWARATNARVHIFSKREKDAQSLLKQVRFGYTRLPEEWTFPIIGEGQSEFALDVGPDDRRLAVAYPSDKETAVQETCLHGHVDEWARMGNPAKVWQAVEPTMAGTCHFVTTGLGPANFTSAFFRNCLTGDLKTRRDDSILGCFIAADTRPGRSQAWIKQKRLSLGDETAAKQEYPMTWEEALSGGGDYVFTSKECDLAGIEFRGIGRAQPGRKYVKAWDIGRHKDAAVCVVLDVTETPMHDVVHYERLREQTYPTIQQTIEIVHRAFPGKTYIEDNAAGEAVRENLTLKEWEVEGVTTTNASKARFLQETKLGLQAGCLKWDPRACQQLDKEVRGYQLPDENVVQDSVIALAIAQAHAADAFSGVGRVLGVLHA